MIYTLLKCITYFKFNLLSLRYNDLFFTLCFVCFIEYDISLTESINAEVLKKKTFIISTNRHSFILTFLHCLELFTHGPTLFSAIENFFQCILVRYRFATSSFSFIIVSCFSLGLIFLFYDLKKFTYTI